MSSELISIGLSVVDHLFLCDEPPGGDVVHATDYLTQGGGLAATAAVTMARLGGRVEIWTRVGDGPAGRAILDEFQREGVDTSQVKVCPGGRSPVCAVRVDRPRADRFFTCFPGRGLTGDAGCLDMGRIDTAKAVLVDRHWHEAELPAAQRARRCRVPVCGDIERITDESAELIQYVDYPIYPLECAQDCGGSASAAENLRKLAELGGSVPMVTLGSDGCIWLEGGEVRRCEAFDVDVVDTTGCGDVFHGAFTFGLARGWSVDRNARFASATAALKCRALGGRTGIPTYHEVTAFLERHA